MEEKKGGRSCDPVRTAATEGWRIRPWPVAQRTELAISFGGLVAEETSNIYYTVGMENEDEPVEKALMASSLVTVTSEDSVNSNLTPFMVDSGALGRYFDDAAIRDLKHRLQDYVHPTTPRKILTARGTMLDGTGEGVLQGLVTDDTSFGPISWWCSGLGATCSR